MAYVEAPKEHAANPFVDLPKKSDEEGLILHRGKTVYIALNRFPYNAGHLLVIPYREVADILALTEEEKLEFFDALLLGKQILERGLNPHGFNIGINFGAVAGAGIPQHLHAHIVPRWTGDTNFMPVLGQTRVLPIALLELWKRLKGNDLQTDSSI